MGNDFFQTLGYKLFSTRSFSDITFVVDSEEFQLHRDILAASCPYFETMLFGHTNEASMKTITLRDTPKKLFEKVVRFIYTGELVSSDLASEEWVNLISLAHEYQFKELLTHAISVSTTENSSVDCVASILNLPFIHEQKDTQEKCLDFFDRFASSVVQNIAVFATLSPKSMCALIARDSFEAPEVDIFTALKMWVEARGNRSDDYVVFSKLRLNLISVADFNRIVKPTNLVSSESYLLALEEMSSKKRFKKRVTCSTHDSRCSGEIVKCYAQRFNITIDQVVGCPSPRNFLKVTDGDTIVIEVKQVPCKMSFVRFTFRDASSLDPLSKLDVIGDRYSKPTILSAQDGTHVEFRFPPQVVKKMKFPVEFDDDVPRMFPPFRFEVQNIEIF